MTALEPVEAEQLYTDAAVGERTALSASSCPTCSRVSFPRRTSCPACGARFPWTECLACGARFAHAAWYRGG